MEIDIERNIVGDIYPLGGASGQTEMPRAQVGTCAPVANGPSICYDYSETPCGAQAPGWIYDDAIYDPIRPFGGVVDWAGGGGDVEPGYPYRHPMSRVYPHRVGDEYRLAIAGDPDAQASEPYTEPIGSGALTQPRFLLTGIPPRVRLTGVADSIQVELFPLNGPPNLVQTIPATDPFWVASFKNGSEFFLLVYDDGIRTFYKWDEASSSYVPTPPAAGSTLRWDLTGPHFLGTGSGNPLPISAGYDFRSLRIDDDHEVFAAQRLDGVDVYYTAPGNDSQVVHQTIPTAWPYGIETFTVEDQQYLVTSTAALSTLYRWNTVLEEFEPVSVIFTGGPKVVSTGTGSARVVAVAGASGLNFYRWNGGASPLIYLETIDVTVSEEDRLTGFLRGNDEMYVLLAQTGSSPQTLMYSWDGSVATLVHTFPDIVLHTVMVGGDAYHFTAGGSLYIWKNGTSGPQLAGYKFRPAWDWNSFVYEGKQFVVQATPNWATFSGNRATTAPEPAVPMYEMLLFYRIGACADTFSCNETGGWCMDGAGNPAIENPPETGSSSSASSVAFEFDERFPDFNADCIADGLDQAILEANFGTDPATFEQGDASGDGVVDDFDRLILQLSLGQTDPDNPLCAASSSSSSTSSSGSGEESSSSSVSDGCQAIDPNGVIKHITTSSVVDEGAEISATAEANRVPPLSNDQFSFRWSVSKDGDEVHVFNTFDLSSPFTSTITYTPLEAGTYVLELFVQSDSEATDIDCVEISVVPVSSSDSSSSSSDSSSSSSSSSSFHGAASSFYPLMCPRRD
jgi:hypothetical protein